MALHQIIHATVAQRGTPGQVGDRDSEFCFGECIDVTELADDQAYGTNVIDSYPGWVAQAALSAEIMTPTHRVTAHSAFAYTAPRIRSTYQLWLPLGAYVTATGETEAAYTAIRLQGQADPLWLPTIALQSIDSFEPDFVAVAERLLGVPYLWGGRTAHGIDCSGLVQLALSLCGVPCPRDSNQQEAWFKASVAMEELQRGDLLFANRHVAIVMDRNTIIHANEQLHHAVAIESFVGASARYDFHAIKRPVA